MPLTCFYPGCAGQSLKMGFCMVHFTLWRSHAYASRERMSEGDRFWSKVDKSGDCWLWTGGGGKDGYGMVATAVGGLKRKQGAHRWAYEHEVGAIPDGMQLDHLCRVHRCVRPSHLEPVTNLENVRRSIAAGVKRGRPRKTVDGAATRV